MSNAKRKLFALNSCRSKLNTSGNRTSKVSQCVLELADAFDSYIMNDNIDGYSLVAGNLRIKIEEHPDFETAVRHLNAAIRAAEEEIRREEEEARRKREALLKGGW